MTTIKILSDETQVNAVTKALGGSRKLFDSAGAALAHILAAAETTESFYGLPLVLAGVDSDTGDIDESKYDGMQAMVAIVGARVDTGAKRLNGIKGIVLLPVPTLESYLSSDAGKDWLEKIAEKESAHVSFRPFRDAASVEEFMSGVDRVPNSVEAFATESARAGGVNTETFDTVWKSLRTQLAKEKPALAKLLPQKPEVIKAIRSKAHAQEAYPELEGIRAFEWLANLVVAAAGKMDTSDITKWIAGRDEFVFPAREAAAPDFSALSGLDLFGGADDSEGETASE